MAGRTQIAINGRFLSQPITGVQRYAHEMLKALDVHAASRSELEFRLLTPRLGAPAPQLKFIRHEAVGRLQGHAWEQLEFPRHVGNDIVFCPGNTAPLVLLLGGSRVVVTVHDLSYLYFPSAYSRSFRALYHLVMPQVLRRAQTVITVSEAEKAAIARHYPESLSRIVAIQNGGMPAGQGIEPHREDLQDPFILYVGSLSKRKNLPAMLEVASRLAIKRNLRFVFIGGTASSLTESTLDIAPEARDRFTFLGQVNDWLLLRDYYRAAACFFFPSLYESSGLPPLEAMGCGCPVVASSIPALVERCGNAALYCDPGSVDDMCEKLEQLVDNRDLQESLRSRGYSRASEFTWESCAARTIEALLGPRLAGE